MHEEATASRPEKSLNHWIDRWATDISALQKDVNRKNLLGWGILLLGVLGGCLIVAALSDYAWIGIIPFVAGLAAGIVLLVRARSSRNEAVQQLATEIARSCEAESLSKPDVVERLWSRQIKGAISELVLGEVDPATVGMLDLRRRASEFFEDKSATDISPVKINVSTSGSTVSSVTLEGEKAVNRFSAIAVEYLDYAAYIESIAALATLQGIYTQIAPPGGEIMIAGTPDSHPLKQVTLSAHKMISSFDFKTEMEAIYSMLTKKRTQSLLMLIMARQQSEAERAIEQAQVDMSALAERDEVFVGACIDYLGRMTDDFFKRNKISQALALIPDKRILPYILKAFEWQPFFPQGIDAVVRMQKEARDPLLEAFKSGSTSMRFDAGLALGIIDPEGVKPEMEQLLPTLTQPMERIACYYTMVRAGDADAVSEIADYLGASDDNVCHGAAIALQHLQDPIDEEIFHQHLDHGNNLVRLRLVRKLGSQGTDTPALWDALIARFDDGEEMVRSAAAEAIGSMDGDQVYDRVLEAARGGTVLSRVSAYGALGKLGNADAVPVLMNGLDTARDNDLRRAAISALGELGAVEALERIKPYLSNDELSNAAYWAVLRIGMGHKDAALQVLQRQRSEPKALFMRTLLDDEGAKGQYKRLLSPSKDVKTLLTAMEFAPILRDPEFEQPIQKLITYRRHANFPGDRYVPYLAVKALIHIKLAKSAQEQPAG
jgi:HEAT repeat protein